MNNPPTAASDLTLSHPKLLKPLTRSIAVLTLSVALIATGWARESALRLDAPTEDGQIAQLTAQLLEHEQFAHHRLDGAMAANFLDQYLNSLDGSHELFIQSDVAEFRRSIPKLADETGIKGDTRLAHLIYDRFLKRLGERQAFVTKVLADDKFDFTGQDRFSFDRENAAPPRAAAEAQKLWRQRLRAEILQEKHSLHGTW